MEDEPWEKIFQEHSCISVTSKSTRYKLCILSWLWELHWIWFLVALLQIISYRGNTENIDRAL